MPEEKSKDDVRLFLENKKDIEEVRERVEKLFHKIDIIGESFKRMEVGFGHSRETGHKTWEAVQEMTGKIGGVINEVSHHNNLFDVVNDKIERIDKKVDKKTDDTSRTVSWLIRGTILVVFVYIIMSLINNGIFS